MATNVLVIPEDFRKDQFVLRPIIKKMMAALGLTARVQICMDPLLGGVGEALKWERLEEIIQLYQGMTHIFLLIVDRDGKPDRRAALDRLEGEARKLLPQGKHFLAENAWQEVEVWVLAGLTDVPKAWAWKDIRAEVDPKEVYFDDHARRRGVLTGPHGGRLALAEEAAANYPRIRQLCPEDVAHLEERVRMALTSP